MGFDFVAAIFRLRKSLESKEQFSQTKVCGYKKPNYDTPTHVERGTKGERSEVHKLMLQSTSPFAVGDRY